MKYILSQKEYEANTCEHHNTLLGTELALKRTEDERNDLAIALWQALRDNPENEPCNSYTIEVDSALAEKILVQVGYRFSHESPITIYLFEKSLLPE